MTKLNIATYLFLIFLISSCSPKEKEGYQAIQESREYVPSEFVGSNTCKSCHQKEFETWEGSHHDQAMKIADATSILANFNNTTFTHKNIKSTFFKKEGDYFVNTEGADGTNADFKIVYTFGVIPLQQYIVEFPNGAFQCLSTAWNSKENKWFYLQPDLDIKHDEWLHWTGGSMNWNTMCAECHSTNVQKNYDSKTAAYNTTFSEINVSCESCHGPSSSHVDYYENPSENSAPPKMYMDSTLTSTQLVDKCARCHSRRSQVTKYFDYKGEFKDHYLPSLLVEGLYELDGQISDEVYVYGSFVQSKMYHNGVSCKDCHDVHSLKLKKQGNDLCMSCHTPNYNTEAHHFHQLNSDGAKCINCHMTGKTYMGNDFRRDHSFRVPRPDQTVAYNVPNACNSCHTDKSAEWASDIISSNYGEERADHFSDHLLKGYFGNQSEYEILMANSNYPEIARATAIGQYTSQQLTPKEMETLLLYINDSSALVRNEVIASLERMGNTTFAPSIEPFLKDSLRVVRIAAARYFNMTGQDVTSNPDYKNANSEFLDALNMNADFASGQHQIALYYQAKGETDKAIVSYKRAVSIDNYFNRSRMNLALLYYNEGNIDACEKLYLKVIEQEPDFSYPYYMLGLLYNESGNNEKVFEFLEKSIVREPVNQNAFYNYAIKLQEAGQHATSIKILINALDLFPNNERLLYAKFVAEANSNLLNDAKVTCLKLIEIAPNNTSYRQLLERLNLQMSN